MKGKGNMKREMYNIMDSIEDRFRNAVLDALDKAAGHSFGCNGWTDQDLPELFRAIDAQVMRVRARAEKSVEEIVEGKLRS